MDYNKVYIRFIESRRGQGIAGGEKHHILPRSLGGSDAQDNLVLLTVREHVFAHALLAKIHGGRMWYAYHMMVCTRSRPNLRAAVGRGQAMRDMYAGAPWRIDKIREEQRLRMQSPEARAILRAAAEAQWGDRELRSVQSHRVKRWFAGLTSEALAERARAIACGVAQHYENNPDDRGRVSAQSRAFWTPAERDRQSALMHDLWKDTEYVEKQRAAHRAAVTSDDYRKRMSTVQKAAGERPELRAVRSAISTKRMQDKAVRTALSRKISSLVWVTDGRSNRRVLPDEIPEGFVRGRVPRASSNPA